MDEPLTTWMPSWNGAVRVESSDQRTTSDSGALRLGDALNKNGVINAMADSQVDRCHPLRIRHSLASQRRTRCRRVRWVGSVSTIPIRRSVTRSGNRPGMTSPTQDRPMAVMLDTLCASFVALSNPWC